MQYQDLYHYVKSQFVPKILSIHHHYEHSVVNNTMKLLQRTIKLS